MMKWQQFGHSRRTATTGTCVLGLTKQCKPCIEALPREVWTVQNVTVPHVVLSHSLACELFMLVTGQHAVPTGC